MGLRDQIAQLQKTNLVDVSPTIQVRRFSGEGSGSVTLDSDMELYYGWDIDADTVADSLEVVKSMIKVSTSGDDDVYDGSEIHYQLVINFNSVVRDGGLNDEHTYIIGLYRPRGRDCLRRSTVSRNRDGYFFDL